MSLFTSGELHLVILLPPLAAGIWLLWYPADATSAKLGAPLWTPQCGLILVQGVFAHL